MRANARRIGRIVGQLEDLVTLASTYRDAENHGEYLGTSAKIDLHDDLHWLTQALARALDLAEKTAAHLNERDRPTGEPLAKR